MITFLIVLAIWFIPIVINFYLGAIMLKLEGKPKVTVQDVLEELEGLSVVACFPLFNICLTIILIMCTLLTIFKNFRLL